LAEASRFSLPLTVIMFDIDDFKHFNDKYGHSGGDEILKIVTKNCKANLRNFDLLGRYGGDEFVILLPKTDLTLAVQVAERLCQSINESQAIVNGENISITVSMGIAGYKGGGNAATDTLMRLADKAMYKAKGDGKNQMSITVFESET